MRAILTYHSIDESGSPISITPEAFERHVLWLATRRVRVLPLDALAAATGDAVAITFDDAFASVATYAAPRLAAHGLPATVFAVSGAVGRTNAWDDHARARVPQLPLLDWDALGALDAFGLTVGCHTRSHPRLDALSDAAAADEILGGRAELERRLGRSATAFAYPYGHTSAAAAACVRAHFACGVTTELRALGPRDDPALLPRLDAYYFRAPGQLERWGTPRFAARLQARAGARRVKRWLRRG